MKTTIIQKKLLISLLSATTITASIYAFKLNRDNKALTQQLKRVTLKNETITKEILSITDNYKSTADKNKKLSKRVINEINTIISLKGSVNELDSNLNNLKEEKKEEEKELANNKNITQNLTDKNKVLSTEIAKAKELSLSSFHIVKMRKKINGKYTETNSVKKTDLLKIDFKIEKNNLALVGEKIIHIQLINPEQEIISVQKQAKFNTSECSDEIIVDYHHEIANVTSLIKINRDSIKQGEYKIKAFIDGRHVKDSSFVIN